MTGPVERRAVDRGPVRTALSALVQQVWGAMPGSPDAADWPVRVTWGPQPKGGYRRLESYCVAPNRHQARLLVPLVGRTTGSRFLVQNRSLRPPKVRLLRTAMGAAFTLGLGPRVLRDRLVVWVRGDVPEQELSRYLLLDHLGERLAVRGLSMGVGVREPDPNYKPSLQLFAPDGSALGYAKIGWNDSTRELVRNETAALQALSATPNPAMSTPMLRYEGEWAGRVLLVASPLPEGLRRYRTPRVPPGPQVLEAVAGPHRQRSPLAGSEYWRRTGRAVEAVAASGDHQDLAAVLRRYVAWLERTWGHVEIDQGRWHGDWVPWNVGTSGARLHVWDWEHSATPAPLGFDLAHWHFQVAFVLSGRPLDEAIGAVRDACEQGWPRLGLSPQEGRLVAALYALEAALRGYRLMRGGGGWHPRLYPAVLDVLAGAVAEAPAGPTG